MNTNYSTDRSHLKGFSLLGRVPEGTCELCARAHEHTAPHNNQSLAYQYKFFEIFGRWPKWADAMAHCAPDVQANWTEKLAKYGVTITDEDRAAAKADFYVALPFECEDFEDTLLLPVGDPREIEDFGGQSIVWAKEDELPMLISLALHDQNEVVIYTRKLGDWYYVWEPSRTIKIEVANPEDFGLAVQEARLLIWQGVATC